MRPNQFDPGPEPQPVARRKPPIFALVAISAVSPFAINSVLPSLPAIALAFDASYSRVQLLLSLYLAAIATAQIFVGPLSDRFGRRPVLFVGFALFIASSLLALAAPNVEALIAIRVVQGATGCVGIVLGRAIVRDLFERRQAASMLGYVTMGLAVAPMVAPVIGGLLQETLGWGSIFAFTALLGIIAIVVTWAFVPETNLHPTSRLSFATVFRDFGLLGRNLDFILFTASFGFTAGVFFAFLGGAPYIAEHILGLSPGVYGAWFGVTPVGYMIGNYISARFTDRFGVARMILGGSIVGLAAALLSPVLFHFGFGGRLALFLPMVIVGVANGMVMPSAISGAISVRPEIAGAAAGLSGAVQIGIGAALSAAAGAALAGGTSAMPLFVLMSITGVAALLVAIAIYPRNRPQP